MFGLLNNPLGYDLIASRCKYDAVSLKPLLKVLSIIDRLAGEHRNSPA
jgi:hypothetical protein